MPEPDPFSAIKTPWDSATPASGSVAGGPGGSSVPVPDHTLLRRVGQGAYGEVWLARNAIGQFRAVKIIHRRAFDSDRPFEREMAGIQRFEPVSRRHESQLNILHVGRGPDYFYYVMELADDQSSVIGYQSSAASDQATVPAVDSSPTTVLNPDTYSPRTLRSELLFRGRLPVDECIRLGLALTTALEHLHRHGLVHRDIKPSNIVFVNGIPKLADIGLVAQAERTMSFVGTEGYLPPEGPGSVQADLFSLGRVLYEISTGHDRQQFPELPTNVVELPDRAALAEFNEVLVRACAPDVKQRYQTAAEMHADLALLQSGKSVARSRWVERRLKFVARAGAVVTALAAVIAAGWLWQARQTRVVRDLADEKSRLAGEKDAAARQSRQRLIQMQSANGLRALEENDPAAAALWFAEALLLSEGDTHAQARQRFRLGTLFHQMPKPVAQMRLQNRAHAAWLTPQGESAVGVGYTPGQAGGTAEMKVWDLASQRLLHSLVLSNATEAPRVSPNAQWAVVPQQQQTRIWNLGSDAPLDGPWELHRTAFSPDERKIAGTQPDGTDVFIRELPSSRLLSPPLQHSNVVTLVTFDPTGRWLVTGTQDPSSENRGWARIWDAVTGQPQSDWIEVLGGDHRASFSPDGDTVAIYPSWSRSVYEPLTGTVVLDLPSGKLRFPRLLVRGAVDSVVFSPDGRHLAIGPKVFAVQVFHAQTGEVLHRELRHENVHDLLLRCSPDGAWLAAAGETGVRIWDLRSGARVGSPLHLSQSVIGLDFLPAGNRMLCADASGLISIYDVANAEMSESTYAPPDRWFVTSGRFAPDGKHLATAGAAGDVNIWSLKGDDQLPTALRATSQFVTKNRFLETQIAWSPDGTWLAVAKNDSTVRIWNAASGLERYAPLNHSQFVADLEFSRDGTRLATASLDGTARLWDVATGHPSTVPLQHSNAVVRIRFSPDGHRVLTGTENGEARWWDARSGEPLSAPLKRWNEITDVAISPDGSRAAIAGDTGEVVMVDAKSGEPLGIAARHGGRVYRASFSPDGRRLLTASRDKTARLWDVASGMPSSPPLMHRDAVWRAGFSPDGQRVITGSADGIARVWDAASGEPLSAPIRQEGAILSAGFSPDGNRVFISSLNGSSQVREVPWLDWGIEEIIAAAQLSSGTVLDGAAQTRPLTPAQAEAAWSKVAVRLRAGPSHPIGGEASWHQQQMLLNERIHDWFAAAFHGRRILELLPGEAAPRAELARLFELRPPPRDPVAPPELIDLTAYYNGPLSVNWLQGEPENHLAELPRGIQRLAGTLFDVRGLIQLRDQPPAGGAFHFPLHVNGIRVNRKLRNLHFLHSTTGDTRVKKGASIGHYRIHYATGRTEEIPIRYQVDISDWWEGPRSSLPEAPVAWRGMNPIARLHGMAAIRLFKFTWTNPAPDLEVSHVDFVSARHYGRPFLIALTAE